jgi:methyl-accepting chemotaxis protein
MAEMVLEISSASREQNIGVEQVTSAIGQLDQVIQQNASTSDALASSSEALSGQATELQAAMAIFKLAVSPPPSQPAARQEEGTRGRSISQTHDPSPPRPNQKAGTRAITIHKDSADNSFEEF